jgi:hypothetical protein
MNNFLDLADLSREQIVELLALADRLQSHPNRRRSRENPRAAVLQSVCEHSRPFRRHGAAGRKLFRDLSR